MGFWSGYRASLKPLEVEEPIDVYVHRPFGYVLAKLAVPTPISPNLLTILSIVFGIACGASFAARFPYHLQIAGLSLFIATVLDCADGQLARLRKTSSTFGRMIDGVADSVSLAATCAGGTWFVYTMYATPHWHGAIAVALTLTTIYTSQLHTSAYDHYKNVFLRLTERDCKEGEDLDAAIRRHETARQRTLSVAMRFTYLVYLTYLRGQRDFVTWFDPHTETRLDVLPPFDPKRAEIYRRHMQRPMRVVRGLFGVGSLVFGISLFTALGRPDVYLLFRLVGYNLAFWLWYGPMQRRASRDAFREMGLGKPTGEPAIATEHPA
jgi:hypothetical protein